ncbi:DNA (cytosine-5-)-methyltransferase [Bifidobacterium sp. B3998]|uniref:DNA (cytosine-5-)-methyltransferase n=1 Tax=Bifidobacterium sp. B3998 TaxID=2817963 RepID=UPI00226BA0BB|nr:DNA cytosine methyltransferase [Bifidobacterium sp. B3998]
MSIFSGIEAASVAWRPLGWEPVAFSEIEPFPSAVLAARYPRVPNFGDVTKIDWRVHSDCTTADLVVGGSPCQSFSIAGRREGLEGASGLMWEYVRAIRELRPRWLVWENVPGALSSSGGEDFRCLLRALDGLGYGLAWRILDAQYFGVAQRRRRVFLVGSLGSQRAAEVLFEPESLRWDHPTGRAKRQALARQAQGSLGDADDGGGCLTPWDTQSRRVYRPDGAWPTLDTRARSGGDGRAVALDYHPQGSRIKYADEDVSQTLSARMGTGGNNVPLVQERTVAFLPNAGHRAGSMAVSEELSPTLKTEHNPAVLCASNRGPRSSIGEDVSPSLMAADDKNPNVVLCATDSGSNAAIGEDLTPTLTAHDAKSASYVFSAKNAATAGLSVSSDTSPTLSATKQPAVSGGGMVRRLMPVECERLQGFPSGWTDVPYKGKDHAPDSPRYKALGNSMAVPVMAWIGWRIQQAEEPTHDVA